MSLQVLHICNRRRGAFVTSVSSALPTSGDGRQSRKISDMISCGRVRTIISRLGDMAAARKKII
jgi:hypothetical protein